MLVLLYESSTNVINSVVDRLYKAYPLSCRGKVYKRTPYDNIAVFANPPLLRNGWLIECSSDITNTTLKKLNDVTKNNIILLRVETYKRFTEMQDQLTNFGYSFKSIDNHKVDQDVVVDYIFRALAISYDDAKYLYKRHNGYIKDIVHSVRMLESFSSVSRSDIRKFTLATERTSINDIVPFLLGSNIKVSYDSIINLLYQYQYGFDFLLKFIKGQLETYLAVYSEISVGVLSLRNYKTYKNNTDDKKIKGLTEYQLSKVIESYEIVSVELLYTVYEFVCKLKANREGLIELIRFLHILRR